MRRSIGAGARSVTWALLLLGELVQAQGAVEFPGDVPAFDERALATGIDHTYDGPWEYFVGGGVATFDCNGDRMPDVFLAGGSGPSALFVNQSLPTQGLRFDRHDSAVSDLTGVIGAYPLDIDADGMRDLVILRVGENRVYKGGPDCSFKLSNASLGIDGGRSWTTAFSATFEPDLPGPTLAFGNYVDRSAPGSPWGTCDDNVLMRPQASLPLNYEDAISLSPGHCALSMVFTDWNRSGEDALRVTNDRHYYRDGEEQLWRVPVGGYPRLYSRADGWEPLVIWGMGIAEADLNADGYPEYALTSMGDTRLQQLDVEQASDEDRPVYQDIAWDRGATAHRPYIGDDPRPSTGWHAEFADVNNDARLDLFIAKGNVEAMSDFAAMDPDNLLLGRADGRFTESGAEAGIDRDTRGRGASLTDLDADGDLDLIVVNRGAPVSVFENLGMHSPAGPRAGGNWLALELRQAGPNRDAIGARVSVQTGNLVQTRRVRVGGGHASGSLGFIHLGLGVAERATVRIQWPDGEWSAAFRLFANRHAVITRGESHVMQWFPPAEINATTTGAAPPTITDSIVGTH